MEKENRIDDIKAELELREKRLKLVYKILYVAVALWAALFVAYFPQGLRSSGSGQLSGIAGYIYLAL